MLKSGTGSGEYSVKHCTNKFPQTTTGNSLTSQNRLKEKFLSTQRENSSRCVSFDRVRRNCVVRVRKTNDGSNYLLRHVSLQGKVWTSNAVHEWLPLGLNIRENDLSVLLATQ